ncbi:MAG: metallophosphoesterase family protein, partial [Lachnospiraceae bacterium]|nr:metallophosphoesterase family protein [Lachnospiraceae bacterium]
GRIADYDVIVYGHSHRFAMEQIGGTLFLNPGSCGPRRFRQNITMAILRIENGQIISAERIDLPDYIPAADSRSRTAKEKEIPADIRDRIEKAVRMIKKGKSVTEIAVRLRLDHDLAENICRMYLTHPGVDIDGIMRRLGL